MPRPSATAATGARRKPPDGALLPFSTSRCRPRPWGRFFFGCYGDRRLLSPDGLRLDGGHEKAHSKPKTLNRSCAYPPRIALPLRDGYLQLQGGFAIRGCYGSLATRSADSVVESGLTMRAILWTVGSIVGGLLSFAAFTEACDLVSAPSTFKVVMGVSIFALLAGSAITVTFAAMRHIASRTHPRIEVVNSGVHDSARRVDPD